MTSRFENSSYDNKQRYSIKNTLNHIFTHEITVDKNQTRISRANGLT